MKVLIGCSWGKVMVFGGDCRRVLPIVPKGNRRQTLDAFLVFPVATDLPLVFDQEHRGFIGCKVLQWYLVIEQLTAAFMAEQSV